jgi:histidinol-phosphate aminotransferase
VAGAPTGLRAAHRYPDPAGEAVVAGLAERLAVDPARLVLGCGAVALCQQVVQAMCGPGDEVVFAAPAFDAYSLLTRIAGAVPRPVPLDAAHRHDVQATLATLTDATRVVFLTNPHNPTGTALRHRELSRLLNAVPDRVLVVLDEAYREFVTDPDVPDGLRLAAGRDNVAVLRTFSKAYGLAGLRIGYGVAPPTLAAALRTVGLPFAVNTAALRQIDPWRTASLPGALVQKRMDPQELCWYWSGTSGPLNTSIPSSWAGDRSKFGP